MKKLLILSAMCLAMTAQATVLRVSNVPNSGAPYSTIPAALEVAVAGDTIMVDGSPDAYNDSFSGYSSLTISKRIVLMGPGYLLTQNNVQSNGDQTVKISRNLIIGADATGTIIQGINFTSNTLDVQASNVVITRCKLDCDLSIGTNATNCVVHQNLITGFVGRGNYNDYIAYNAQVTNNIFLHANNSTLGVLRGFKESTIAYNTFTKKATSGDSTPLYKLEGCTVEHNIFFGAEKTFDNNTLVDNYWGEGGGSSYYPLEECSTDLEVQNANLENQLNAMEGKGAFAGDDPYVISGIPAGPVIQDITVPSTVEQGGTLNVTIKLGIQK